MVLVVAQFSISIVLIIGTVIVYNQLHYMQNKKLGFNKEHFLVIPIQDDSIREKYDVIKNELLKNSDVIAVSASSILPASSGRQVNIFLPEGAKENETQAMDVFMVEPNFIEVMGMKMAEGRHFSADLASDETGAFIINETAAKKLGWQSAVDKQFKWINMEEGKEGRIIGVVKDFHASSLHQPIGPIVLHIRKENYNCVIAMIRSGNISATLSSLKNKWQEFDPARPFEYFFLDDTFDELYRAEDRLGKLFTSFAGLAIFVACLGLYGLASFSAEQRTKEIGIRKVLGASVGQIVLLLSKEFTKWVIIANIIAWPIAYFAINKWLQNFTYKISLQLHLWIFFAAGLAALIIALATISFQAVKAATANPVDALKYE